VDVVPLIRKFPYGLGLVSHLFSGIKCPLQNHLGHMLIKRDNRSYTICLNSFYVYIFGLLYNLV
jgi:hypothetical protein